MRKGKKRDDLDLKREGLRFSMSKELSYYLPNFAGTTWARGRGMTWAWRGKASKIGKINHGSITGEKRPAYMSYRSLRNEIFGAVLWPVGILWHFFWWFCIDFIICAQVASQNGKLNQSNLSNPNKTSSEYAFGTATKPNVDVKLILYWCIKMQQRCGRNTLPDLLQTLLTSYFGHVQLQMTRRS